MVELYIEWANGDSHTELMTEAAAYEYITEIFYFNHDVVKFRVTDA